MLAPARFILTSVALQIVGVGAGVGSGMGIENGFKIFLSPALLRNMLTRGRVVRNSHANLEFLGRLLYKRRFPCQFAPFFMGLTQD